MDAPIRALLVEDDRDAARLLEEYMATKDVLLVHVEDGASALARLAEQGFDVVLLDVMLPGIDGFEVCRRIRAMPALAATRIMLVTARGREAEIARGLALGADAYLTKPFSTRELMDRVRALLAAPRPTTG